MGTLRKALRSKRHRRRSAHALAQHPKASHTLRIFLNRLGKARCKLANDFLGSNVVDARQPVDFRDLRDFHPEKVPVACACRL